jgi:hypothetical protein
VGNQHFRIEVTRRDARGTKTASSVVEHMPDGRASGGIDIRHAYPHHTRSTTNSPPTMTRARLSLGRSIPTIIPWILASACSCGDAEADRTRTGPETLFTDAFDRDVLGPRYRKQGGTWDIEGGALHSSGEHNIPLWLDAALPRNAKVEITAWSKSNSVDTKVEIFGDGTRHESGYIAILGGWNNTITTIARLDEHEKTRVEVRRSWEKNKKYRWTVERTDGKTLRLLIDGQEVLAYVDRDPLVGNRNDRFAFTNWESDVYYDDLVVTALPD